MLYLKCKGQVVSIDVDERFADKYINANTVHFEFCERWAGMTITAQFTQNEKTYDVLVDEVTNTVTMPNEITVGEVEISVFGVHPETGVRLTTIPVKKKVEKSGFVGDGETPIPPSPDLYAQLIAKVEDAELAQAENIKNAVDAYLTENPVEPGATKEQAEQIEANRKAIEEYVPPVTSVNGMTGDVVIAAGGGAASSVEWSNVVNKPETYPPEAHGHTWNDVTEKPEAYPPSEHTHSYADLEDKPTIPTVPRFLPNPYSLTINGESYDGSSAVEVTIDAGNDVEIDETLTQGGKAADAKKTGDALNQLSEQMDDYRTALNLLDNSDFKIAQAGYGGFHGNIKYAADRWFCVNSDTTTFAAADGGGLKITKTGTGSWGAWIRQKVIVQNTLKGKTVTLGVKAKSSEGSLWMAITTLDVNGNEIDSVAKTFSCGEKTIQTLSLSIPGNANQIQASFDHSNAGTSVIEIEWAAIYEGEYTAETLPPYVPKGYAVELTECLRYYQGDRYHLAMASIDSGGLKWYVDTPVDGEMRNSPTVTIKEIRYVGANGSEQVFNTLPDISVTKYRYNARSVVVTVAFTSAPIAVNNVGSGYMMMMYDLSADL